MWIHGTLRISINTRLMDFRQSKLRAKRKFFAKRRGFRKISSKGKEKSHPEQYEHNISLIGDNPVRLITPYPSHSRVWMKRRLDFKSTPAAGPGALVQHRTLDMRVLGHRRSGLCWARLRRLCSVLPGGVAVGEGVDSFSSVQRMAIGAALRLRSKFSNRWTPAKLEKQIG